MHNTHADFTLYAKLGIEESWYIPMPIWPKFNKMIIHTSVKYNTNKTTVKLMLILQNIEKTKTKSERKYRSKSLKVARDGANVQP